MPTDTQLLDHLIGTDGMFAVCEWDACSGQWIAIIKPSTARQRIADDMAQTQAMSADDIEARKHDTEAA